MDDEALEAARARLAQLRDDGVEPYPNGFTVSHTSEQVKAEFGDKLEAGETLEGSSVSFGGRLMFRNRMGKAMFLRVQDRGAHEGKESVEGETKAGILQVYVRRDEIGDASFARCRAFDIGDWIWVRGSVMRTKTGELSIQAQEISLASKILRTFPDRWHGVTDIEKRSRQRYVDLFMNEQTRITFHKRSRIVKYFRDFFHGRDFVEVETPMLQSIPGGANARPFVTHHNALDIDLYMRIAPELFLKRLVVGGMERVFEINRNFRNEGISVKHNPEFTMLEFYQAWATHNDLMDLTEELLSGLVKEICGSYVIAFGDLELDFTPPFRRAPMDELIAEATGLDRGVLEDVSALEAWWRENHRVADDEKLPQTWGKWWEWLYDAHVEDRLLNPTFVTSFPTEISPLSRRNDEDPTRVDRFEIVIARWEMGNAFSELNDPVDQQARFAAQERAREAGDQESMFIDYDYVRALEYGMPPTAGMGIGIDRLTMLLTNQASIKEVILFPTLRPEAGSHE
ncbi:MAG: lysine--tRNA ligase [Myxococcota bacterium]